MPGFLKQPERRKEETAKKIKKPDALLKGVELIYLLNREPIPDNPVI